MKTGFGIALFGAILFSLSIGCDVQGPGGGIGDGEDADGGTGVLEIIDEGFGDGGRPTPPDMDGSVPDEDAGMPAFPFADGGMGGGGGMP